MYRIYLDNALLQDPDSELFLIDPVLELAENSAGSFSFALYPDHPQYTKIKVTSRIDFYQVKDGTEKWMWSGRPIRIHDDFDLKRSVECEGVLGWLADTIQEPSEYHDISVSQLLNTFLTKHNSNTDSGKRFKLGTVTVTDSNDSLYRYTNYETTYEAIQDKLVSRLSGILRVRKESDGFYLDYLQDYPRTSLQPIEFGENLINLLDECSYSEIGTILIPLGATLEESQKDPDFPEALEQRVTIKSVNNGSDAIRSTDGVAAYGQIVKVQTWDDVHVPSVLKEKAEAYLNVIKYQNRTITATAIDLSAAGIEIDDFRFLDRIICKSEPHNLEITFPLTEMKIHPLEPDQNLYTLGTVKRGYTKSAGQTLTNIKNLVEIKPSISQVRKIAIDNATSILNQWADLGYAVHTENESYYMDNPDQANAENVLRINMGGIGFSSTGINGPYKSAWTLDGVFNTDFINAGTITADKIAVEYKNSVEAKINLAEQNAKADAAEKLLAYYTKLEVTTAIQNKADEILLSAEQKAQELVDALATNDDGEVIAALANYYTKSQVDVKTNEIKNSVEALKESVSDKFLGVYNKAEVDLLLDRYKVNIEETVKVHSPNLLDGTQYWDRNTTLQNSVTTRTVTGDAKKRLVRMVYFADVGYKVADHKQKGIPYIAGQWYALSVYTTGPAGGKVEIIFRNPKYEIVEVRSPNGTATLASNGKSATLTADANQRAVLLVKLGYKGLNTGNWKWDPFSFQYGVINAGDTETHTELRTKSGYGEFTFCGLQLERGREVTEYNAGTEDLTKRVASLVVGLDGINMAVSEARTYAEGLADSALDDAKAYANSKLTSYYTKSEIDLKTDSISMGVSSERKYQSSHNYLTDFGSYEFMSKYACASVMTKENQASKTVWRGTFTSSTTSNVMCSITKPLPLHNGKNYAIFKVYAGSDFAWNDWTFLANYTLVKNLKVTKAYATAGTATITELSDKKAKVRINNFGSSDYYMTVYLEYESTDSASMTDQTTTNITIQGEVPSGTAGSIETWRYWLQTGWNNAPDTTENYMISQFAQIRINQDSIESEVSKKVGSSEWSTKIRQSATDIQIAWNNISKYIQFANAALSVYDSANTSTQKLRMKLDDNGQHFYRDGYYLGKIGTNSILNNSTKKGLVFDLEYNGAYMSWSVKHNASDTYYDMLLTYCNRSFSTYKSDRFYFGATVDFNNRDVYDPWFKFSDYSSYRPVTTTGSIYLGGDANFGSYYGPFKIIKGIVMTT